MLAAETSGRARITFGKDGPTLTLEDAKGYSTIVGVTQLEKQASGEAHAASAASIVLLDKDKKVIWQTPWSISGK